ncbi:rhodanese-like domain-containing protein [Macrococcus equipercicus]|uniref:Rhodanese-like domain-containing protein n=1 Tax=Macrococcus equipercicus TaxID=69967 RepID=A0A9Q9F3E9_9STAP|nr:rhodanese-like domain-containing protein [Macrococcus equipercicus]
MLNSCILFSSSESGKSLGAVPVTTLGYERINSWAFQYQDEEQFIAALTSEQPEPPYYFKEMKRINRDGVKPYHMGVIAPVDQLDPAARTIDLRAKEVFAENTSDGINIPYNSKFLSFAGWYVDYEKPLQFIGDFEQVQQAAAELKLIGFDKVIGYTTANKVKGKSYQQIQPDEFKALNKQTINILDVRTAQEWNDSHFEEAEHLHYGKLLKEVVPYDKNEIIYVHCQTGVRSAIAMSLLKAKGYKNIVNIKGGYDVLEIYYRTS